jgi:hypothetical protein
MRRLLFLLPFVVAGLALAQVKVDSSVRLDPTVTKKFANCSATGSAVQVLPDGKYVMTVFDERTTLCLKSGCDGGYGTDYPANFGLHITFAAKDGGTPVGCLSAGATGDVHFIKDVGP